MQYWSIDTDIDIEVTLKVALNGIYSVTMTVSHPESDPNRNNCSDNDFKFDRDLDSNPSWSIDSDIDCKLYSDPSWNI